MEYVEMPWYDLAWFNAPTLVRFYTWYQTTKNQNRREVHIYALNRFKFADLFFSIKQKIKMFFNGLRLEYYIEGN